MELFQGDCLKILPTLDRKYDMIFFDLPYGITGNKWDVPIDLTALWEQFDRLMHKHTAVVFTATFPYAATIVHSKPRLFRYDLVYEKPNAVDFFNARKKPLRAHENILVFYNKRPVYNPQMVQGEPYKRLRAGIKVSDNYDPKTTLIDTVNVSGQRFPRSVMKFAREQGYHTTQKPVTLMEWLVKTYTNEGAWILDPTMGSCSMGIACMNTNRHLTGIEKDAAIFQVAKQRVELHANSINKE